jgi:hypothetical protein
MKLTKSRLDTLTDFIVNEVQNKINIYKESKDGQLAFKKYLDRYKDIMPELHQIENLDKDIADLSIKRSNLMTSVTRKVRAKNSKTSVPYTNEALINICNYEFEQELKKTFPTVEQIRTTVVLKTLENSGDLLTKLKEEFNI